jgi:hypothetical protein
MKSAGICVELLVVIATCANAAEQTPIESADRLFKIVFCSTGEQYARIALTVPRLFGNSPVSRIALLSIGLTMRAG